MSQQPASADADTVSLALNFQGLTITVHGPVRSSVEFVRQLTGSAVSAAEVSGQDDHSQASSCVGPGQTIEDSFPDCPRTVLLLGQRLSPSSELSAEGRIRRAWKAGCWAKAVKEGRIPTPNQTPAIELSNRFYVVVQSDLCECPKVFNNARSYFRSVDFGRRLSISHAFPSESEARAYLVAAGETFPGVSS